MRKFLIAMMVLTLAAAPALADAKDDALTAAQGLVGEQATLVESDADDGVYEFRFRDDGAKYDVDILPSGDVLSFETEYAGLTRAKQAALTQQDAQDRVQAAFPQAVIHLILAETDDEDGHTFEAFLTNEGVPAEVSLNAETGEILRVETFPAAQGILTADNVAGWVEAQLSGAAIQELELEYEDGRYLYEGEAAASGAKYSFEFSAADGAMVEWERDD